MIIYILACFSGFSLNPRIITGNPFRTCTSRKRLFNYPDLIEYQVRSMINLHCCHPMASWTNFKFSPQYELGFGHYLEVQQIDNSCPPYSGQLTGTDLSQDGGRFCIILKGTKWSTKRGVLLHFSLQIKWLIKFEINEFLKWMRDPEGEDPSCWLNKPQVIRLYIM